jgi:hypothetical protein
MKWYRRIIVAMKILKQFDESRASIEDALNEMKRISTPGSQMHNKATVAVDHMRALIRLVNQIS